MVTIDSQPGNKSIVEIKDASGKLKHEKKDVAEVFATFYETLYKSRRSDYAQHVYSAVAADPIPAFTMEELARALKQMKAGKARDEAGVVAEMIKLDCPILHEMILDVFNEVRRSGRPPHEWKKSKLVVLFKKGDPQLPENYRPIAILPILYKLFSRMLCARIKEDIAQQQSVDQAAYVKGFSTEDHLLCTTILLEQCAEWNVPLWLGLVDFEKAFDTVEHDSLWKALEELGISHSYINLLKGLYQDQTATVESGGRSRFFELQRGVKQGDPISALLFISVMEAIFRKLKHRWNHLNTRRSGAYYGMVIDKPTEPLTNLRYADDIMLVAGSRGDIGKMLSDLSQEARKYGLQIHMCKTKVLTTDSATHSSDYIKCCGKEVQILTADGTEKYLGRKLSAANFHEIELSNRIATGWAAFFKFKSTLCNKRLLLQDRLKLFDSVVTPCVLYASGTWTMTVERQRRLTSTRRRMLRWMVGTRKTPDEEWPKYIQRATDQCEKLADEYGLTDWVVMQRFQKWKLAGKTASQTDGRWTKRLLTWRPWFRCLPWRCIGHPVKRWIDDICDVAGGRWTDIDFAVWMAMSAPFVYGS